MRSTVLALVSQFCAENGIPSPSALIGASDSHSVKLLAQVRKVLRELVRYRFPAQNVRVAWTSASGEDQGNWRTLFGSDMASVAQGTFWDETSKRKIVGPLSPADWETVKALPAPGPYYRYTIKQDRILISPAMSAGRALAISYYSEKQVYDGDTSTLKTAITKDTDTFFYSDAIMIDGVSWCWKKAVGEEWESDYTLWQGNVTSEMARDGGRVLNLAADTPAAVPGIIVPLWANT